MSIFVVEMKNSSDESLEALNDVLDVMYLRERSYWTQDSEDELIERDHLPVKFHIGKQD
jgi:hypothetical protein